MENIILGCTHNIQINIYNLQSVSTFALCSFYTDSFVNKFWFHETAFTRDGIANTRNSNRQRLKTMLTPREQTFNSLSSALNNLLFETFVNPYSFTFFNILTKFSGFCKNSINIVKEKPS